MQLSYENWNDVFLDENVDKIFNNFHNTYLIIFCTSFAIKKTQRVSKSMPLLSKGIKISCFNKRKLYINYRNSDDPSFRDYYKKYCRVLSQVIKSAKSLYYNKLISKLNNKAKTTWNLVKVITNNNNKISNTIGTMNLNDELNRDPLAIANSFNKYFSNIAKNLLKIITNKSTNTDPIKYLRQEFKQVHS